MANKIFSIALAVSLVAANAFRPELLYRPHGNFTNNVARPLRYWPIDQDYFMDDYAFRRDEPIPPRVDLRTGRVRLLDVEISKARAEKFPVARRRFWICR